MCTVLVVDDDADLRELLTLMLQQFGWQATCARNGVEGQTMALAVHPDLMLLDIMMDRQDGYETCSNLRGLGYTGKIIMISAIPAEEGRPKAEQCGADGYQQKPITLAWLNTLLSSSPT